MAAIEIDTKIADDEPVEGLWISDEGYELHKRSVGDLSPQIRFCRGRGELVAAIIDGWLPYLNVNGHRGNLAKVHLVHGSGASVTYNAETA